jgi:hypothetical protein
MRRVYGRYTDLSIMSLSSTHNCCYILHKSLAVRSLASSEVGLGDRKHQPFPCAIATENAASETAL